MGTVGRRIPVSTVLYRLFNMLEYFGKEQHTSKGKERDECTSTTANESQASESGQSSCLNESQASSSTPSSTNFVASQILSLTGSNSNTPEQLAATSQDHADSNTDCSGMSTTSCSTGGQTSQQRSKSFKFCVVDDE